jgi:hypothetical protein
MAALVIVGCGSGASNHLAASSSADSTSAATVSRQAHPQVVEPVPGQVAVGRPTGRSAGAEPAGSPPRDPSPNQPASVSSAPAKGAPSNAEVRVEVARFQLAIARYHLDRLDLSDALIDPAQLPPGQYNTSIASVFTAYGDPIACGGVLHVAQLGVANKTLPCGTEIIFRYGGRAIRVPVIDRGPYIAGREWDLTGAAAEALHFPGLGLIQWRLA